MSFLTRNRLPLCWQTALRWFSLNLGLFFVFGASQIFVLCIFYQTGPQRIFFFFSHFVLCFDDVNSDLVTAVKQHCLKVQRHFEITMFGATQLVVNFLTSTAKKIPLSVDQCWMWKGRHPESQRTVYIPRPTLSFLHVQTLLWVYFFSSFTLRN